MAWITTKNSLALQKLHAFGLSHLGNPKTDGKKWFWVCVWRITGPKKRSTSSKILLQAVGGTRGVGEMFPKRSRGFLSQHCRETFRPLPSGKQSSGSISSSANSGICSRSSAGFVRSTVLPSERLISSSLLSTRAKMRKTNWSIAPKEVAEFLLH